MSRLTRLTTSTVVTAIVLFGLSGAGTRIPNIGALLDPASGLYLTARRSVPKANQSIDISALSAAVSVVRDERGVPHIFADSDQDALIALGYMVAKDRLFQLDFIPRAGSGRLAEVLGPGAVPTDRFLRSIGMDWGANRNAERMERANGVEADLITWFCAGVNEVVDNITSEDLPFEMRLLGYSPDRCSTLQVARLLQFMTYDLAFRSDEAVYASLRSALATEDYGELYPRHAPMNDPIIPPLSNAPEELSETGADRAPPTTTMMTELHARFVSAGRHMGFGYEDGKGSNNWAVSGRLSATGAPILAGDMHLRVSMPAIWYEAQLVTPKMNLYGVTIPGAPGLVEAYNERIAWAFTNTGADQIDHVALELDSTETKYRTATGWSPLATVLDTIRVRGEEPVVDTLLYAPWGPVIRSRDGAVAIRWVAHDTSRTLRAAWDMSHAKSMEEFDRAVRRWDSPMQNIVYADVDGNIAIRSTGALPIRAEVGGGPGLTRAREDQPIWSGRVPFEELPYSANPAQAYVASANQEPTGPWYPYYTGHDWRSIYRALRINELLRGSDKHSVQDFQRYQADVVAVHGRQFAATLEEHLCAGAAAERLRRRLLGWNGEMSAADSTALAYDVWYDTLADLAWDEPALAPKRPHSVQLYRLIVGDINPKWADIVTTTEVETVSDLICQSLSRAATQLNAESNETWGDAHQIVFRHLISSPKFAVLGRGPFSYPGTWETLSPARGRLATHSASWRVVIDLSTSPPTGFGVYPGGSSGNPFSPLYDLHIPTYLRFQLYRLHNPGNEDFFESRPVTARIQLSP